MDINFMSSTPAEFFNYRKTTSIFQSKLKNHRFSTFHPTPKKLPIFKSLFHLLSRHINHFFQTVTLFHNVQKTTFFLGKTGNNKNVHCPVVP